QGPDIEDLPAFEVCGYDGVAIFDLPTYVSDYNLTEGLDNADVTFYIDEEDAYEEEIVDEITNTDEFEGEDGQIIYVRVQEENVPCFTVVELPLVVLPMPEVNEDISDYSICEVENNEATFDLTTKYQDIIDDYTDFEINFYLSEDDAQQNENAIDPGDIE